MHRQFPGDNLATTDIFNDREVCQVATKEHISDIGAEYFERHGLFKLTIQFIGASAMFLCLLHNCLVRILAANSDEHPVPFHYATNLLMIHNYLLIV